MRKLGFCLAEAVQNMMRNVGISLASVSTSAMSLLVLGLFLALSVNVNHITRVLENEVGIRVFLDNKDSAATIDAVGQALQAIPGVARVTYLSKEQALQNLERDFGPQGKLFAGLGSDNPLQNSYEVKAADPKAVGRIARAAGRIPGVASVTYQALVVNRLVAFVEVVRIVGLVIGLLLAFGALLIIHNAIRLGIFARRREIHIMRLVGATERLIRLPFVIEGVTLGLAGGLVAFAALRVAYGLFYQDVRTALPFLPVVSTGAVTGQVWLALVLFGFVLGYVGSRFSLQRVKV
jgi:cell division transport system permease protein